MALFCILRGELLHPQDRSLRFALDDIARSTQTFSELLISYKQPFQCQPRRLSPFRRGDQPRNGSSIPWDLTQIVEV